MALYVIGDTHLSFSVNKSMEVFGGAWTGYVDKLREGFRVLQEGDTLVLCGDISWGMSLQDAREDFAFLEQFPGRKLILKGNHDYWWNTATKMERFWQEEGFSNLAVLHNNCHFYGELSLCGTRGWFYEEDANGHNEKVFRRELIRLEASLKAAGEREKLCFLHYPPCYQGYTCPEILDLLERYQVRTCYYGHLHGGSHRLAVEGVVQGVEYRLAAADYLGFRPKKILD
ncbi:MAG TPA: metallophosphoesterase [Candidatus Flavonifractor merdigallinarum]|uniref:Metallophosphoesterase n=1 Tax=Candidatus Flavonifractor merdigallinarum TaxID=2838589 RepID=A0A9D1YAR2_9FIRM|nr:metallophosphoesterase [Candidatus Flavonifractor merdigallinarum]